MSSINARLAIPTMFPYAVSKGGSSQLTTVMALALGEFGIRVAAIGPGTILTELARAAVFTDDEARRRVLSRTPLGRASEDTSYVTGQTIYADDGRLGLNYTVAVAD